MQNSLIDQGLELMLYGMGMVFIFLALLVVVTSLMSALVRRFVPDDSAELAAGGVATESDSTLIAVIAAAIHKHRSRHK